MKKIIMLLAVGAMALGFTACNDDDKKTDIIPADNLYLPRNNYPIDITTGQTVKFEWEASKAGGNAYVIYELLFDKENGDFSNPLYVVSSANNGYSPTVDVASQTMNTLAIRAGCAPGATVAIKWTVRVWKGFSSTLYTGNNGERTLLVTRPNTIEPLPGKVSIQGSATENQGTLTLSAASVLHSSKGIYKDERENGAFECFTKLTAGEFNIVDDLGRYFYLQDKNTIRISETETEPVATTVSKTGIYWIYLNFNTMTYKMKEISKVEFLLSSPGNMAELTYEGNSVWSIEDYEWNVKVGGNGDTRHKFVCSFADGSVEYWGHFEDDCRGSGESEENKNPLFYNIFRHSYDNKWDNTWKTNEAAREGFGKLVTFRLHMNNTDAPLFLLERSFSDKPGMAIPTSVNISGAATEAQATIALSAASILHTSKGGVFNDDREAGAFEAYTKLTANTLTITDNNGINYSLADDGSIEKASGANATTIKEEGIYRLYLDFNTMKYTMQKISKVEFWRINGGEKAELTYDGNGVWSITDYAWRVEDSGDSRYKFICSFADGTVEHWGHREDDCRQSGFAEPGQGGGATEKGPLFYNVFRLSTDIGEWDHTWKVNQDIREGYGKLATFHVYMNNTKDKLFLHDRSFK